MAINKSLFLSFFGFLVFSFLLIAFPNNSYAEKEGCCQFFTGADPMGCQSFETTDSCNEDSTTPGKKFFPGSECDTDSGFCEGYEPPSGQTMASGCCQMFFGDSPGCMYPSSPSSCSGENWSFVNSKECGEDGYCKGYKKE
ncbi:MAG: hypothetical protein AAF462_11630 [Thermodesulfobacteriota bacterium]